MHKEHERNMNGTVESTCNTVASVIDRELNTNRRQRRGVTLILNELVETLMIVRVAMAIAAAIVNCRRNSVKITKLYTLLF